MTISWLEGKLGDLDRPGRETDTRLPQDNVRIGESDIGRDVNRVLGMPVDTIAITTGTKGPIDDISN